MNFFKFLSLLLILMCLEFINSRLQAHVKSIREKSKDQTPEKHSVAAKTRSMEDVSKVLENALDKDVHQNLKRNDVQVIILDAVFWKYCFPKMVCEINAADPYRSTSSWDALTNLRMTLKSDATSESYDRFHFASTMGYLFYNVDGTGCHNVYPECPLTRVQLIATYKYIMIQ